MTVVAYGDLSAATSADLTVEILLGLGEYVSTDVSWVQTRSGWKAVLLPPAP